MTYVFLALLILIGIIGVAYNSYQNKLFEQEIQAWLSVSARAMTESEINELIRPFADIAQNNDNNERKFGKYDIPYGRASNFLNYFQRSTDTEDPLYYSPIRSKDDIELKEYGFILTNGGIYIAAQQDKQNKDKSYNFQNYDLSFNGLMTVTFNQETQRLDAKYADKRKVSIDQSQTTVPLAFIYNICSKMIESGATKSIFRNRLYKAILY